MKLDPKLFRNVQKIGDKTVAELNTKLATISKWNYRLEHSEEDIEEIKETLGKSIQEIGLKQLPICTPNGEVFAGGRRLIACRELGIEWMPVIVEDADPLHQFAASYAENKHRKEPNWYEEGKKFHDIIQETGVSERELARLLGISVMQVSDKVRSYRKLHQYLQEDVRQAYTITERIARMISTSDIPDDGREKLLNMALEGASEDEIRRVIALTNAAKALLEGEPEEVQKKLEEEFKDRFYTKNLDLAELKWRLEEETNTSHPLSKVRIFWEDYGLKTEAEVRAFFKKYDGVWERNLMASEGYLDKVKLRLEKVKKRGSSTNVGETTDQENREGN